MADPSPSATSDAEPVNFSRDVQPILAARCYACHGPDIVESGLKLTDFESAIAECESGQRAIVPGDPSNSVMLERIVSSDEFERMPPEGEPLGPEEVQTLRRWIEQGAEFTPHWAFGPIADPEVPTLADWSDHPVDAFVMRQLQRQELTPLPLADRSTLLRRLTYGLTGLPPTIQEIEAFESDRSPQAWQRQVDRLLALTTPRRSLGASLARSGSLRRDQFFRAGRRKTKRLEVPRLCDRFDQSRQTI